MVFSRVSFFRVKSIYSSSPLSPCSGALLFILDRMFSTMESSAHVQEAMVKDIYQIGKVLTTRKYLFLKGSSSVFMLGVVVSIILLVIQMM